MREKEFMDIQSALRSAAREPENAPPALVARTVRRCEAVLAGREAEGRLRQGGELSAEEVYGLTAAGLLGRLALARHLPEEQSLPEMTRQLAVSPWLRRQVGGTAEDALRCLRGGALVRCGAERLARRNEGHARGRAPKAEGI